MKHKQLVRSLDVMINLINEIGFSLIVDMEKRVNDCSKDTAGHSSGSAHEGLKVTGHGSADITKALEELGTEDVTHNEAEGDVLWFEGETWGDV